MTTNTRWRAKLAFRKGLLKAAVARRDHYDSWLASARKRDAHPRGWILKARDRAEADVRLRQEQIADAERVLARHPATDTAKVSIARPSEQIITSVRNQSARSTQPAVIVLHSTESTNRPGTGDLAAVVGWFNNPASQASSHVIVDNEGNAAQCVPDERKAWHVSSYNSLALGIEQIGQASQSGTSWTPQQIKKTAQYIAYWSKKYGIPITHSTKRGVCMHSDLGAAGGGHHDPGANYPFALVLQMARNLT